MNKSFRKLANIVYTIGSIIVIGILLLTLLSVLGIPEKLKMFVVETGSMEPNIPTGSLAFVTPANEYKKGDVITFISKLEQNGPKKFIITHRVNDVINDNGDTYFQTKGDANKDVDPFLANKLDVLGKVTFSLPFVGYIVGFAKTPIGFILLVVIPALVIVISEIIAIAKEVKKEATKSKKSDFSSSKLSLNS